MKKIIFIFILLSGLAPNLTKDGWGIIASEKLSAESWDGDFYIFVFQGKIDVDEEKLNNSTHSTVEPLTPPTIDGFDTSTPDIDNTHIDIPVYNGGQGDNSGSGYSESDDDGGYDDGIGENDQTNDGINDPTDDHNNNESGNEQPESESSKYDCAGVLNGTAYIDNCKECVGGTTWKSACDPCLYFNNLISAILASEGGYVNDPADPGGATNKGICWSTWESTAESILGKEPTLNNLKNITDEEAGKIYKYLYWDKNSSDSIYDGDTRYLLFDFYVNAGGNAIKVLQSTLNQLGNNLTVDRAMGSQTLNAINNANPIELYNLFKSNRLNYYQSLVNKRPSLSKFLNGWKNRTNKFPNKPQDKYNNVNCK